MIYLFRCAERRPGGSPALISSVIPEDAEIQSTRDGVGDGGDFRLFLFFRPTFHDNYCIYSGAGVFFFPK